ncbi:hypothetical protein K8I61_19675, partial [bacterium]|nr:hypothetical protein [bacterium]
MNAPTTCLSCPSRPTCRSLCALMERRASQDMRHLRGEEVLMAPDGIARVSRRRGADAMRDLVRDAVEIEDLRRIPGLTGKQIRILAMHFVDGKSYRDIGDALGLNQSTIGEHVLA